MMPAPDDAGALPTDAVARGRLYWTMHKGGMTYPEIAEQYDQNPNTVRRTAGDYNRQRAAAASKRNLRIVRQMPGPEVREKYPDTLEDIEALGDIDPDDLRDADIEELLDIVRFAQRQMAKDDPVITHRTIEIPTNGGPVAIMLAGCFQTGGRWTFHSFIKDKLDEMFSLPGAYIGTFGDEVENFVSGSFAGASSVYEQAISPPLQRLLWGHWMDKYASRMLWGMGSQHGSIWNERLGFNPIKDKFMEHDIPFFDGMAYLKLKVGTQTYNLAGAHEFPGTSMYNPTHAQKRALWQRYPNAHIIAQADKHIYAVSEEYVYSNEYIAGNRATPYVWLIQIGTAKAGPDKYTVRSWERGVSEWPWIVLWPDEFKIKATRHFEDVAMWTQAKPAARPALAEAA